MATTDDLNYVRNRLDVPLPSPAFDLDPLRSSDVVETVNNVLTAYREQQRRAIEGQVVGESDPRRVYATADELRERRATTRLFLAAQVGIAGMAIGGLVGLAALAGSLEAPIALATWVALTGLAGSFLVYRQAINERKHSPEGIALLQDWYQYDLGRRQVEGSVAVAKAYADAVRLDAEGRVEGYRANRAALAGELATPPALPSPRRRPVRFEPPNWEDDQGPKPVFEQDPTVTPPSPAPLTTVSEPRRPRPDALQVELARWVKTLFAISEDGEFINVTAGGAIKGGTPWAARSPLPDAQKKKALALFGLLDPPLVYREEGNGARWRLNLADYPTSSVAVKALAAAWGANQDDRPTDRTDRP